MKQEDALQIALVQYFNLAYGNDYIIQMNYNNAFNGRQGAKAKKMGRKKGFPDIQILDMRSNRVLFLEIKTENGVLSKEQKQLHFQMIKAGYNVKVGFGFDECKKKLDEFCKI